MSIAKSKKNTLRITEILHERGSSMVEEISKVPDVQLLSRALREIIVDELGDEFFQRGLREDGEPNEYGLELENLTDACGLAWD
ncbi:MAG: hypothetical protein MRJ96_16975 [Nitrospirales bacterium]|nr:hypothetical protein [Nitrospira sp.]MDR4503139.1 hypothetical protein [Nitrospirales bacterium]